MTEGELTDAAHAKLFEVLERGGTISVALPPPDGESNTQYRLLSDEAAERRRLASEAIAGVHMREQTAATILAALLVPGERVGAAGTPKIDDDERAICAYAVALTDALRAALAKGRP